MRNAIYGAVLSVILAAGASAQDGYRHTQDDSADASASVSSGPVRMARVALVSGSVSWRPDESVDWSTASANIPLRQGAEIWVNSGGRAEIQFDDGSRLHLGSEAIACLQTLYSDSKGEFSEVRLNSGLATLSLTNKESMYQVDTPLLSAKAYGPSKVRIGIGNDVAVTVRRGEARVEGSQGPTTLEAGQYVDVIDNSTPYEVTQAPPADSWDRVADARDYRYDHPSQFVPSNIGVVCGDLTGYGAWQADPNYGHVWYPAASSRAWRPYHDGHWVWVDPFGWTWVSDEPWGWAPYHYGTWIHSRSGWGWVPGPRHQYWAPAVVSFSVYNGAVAWVPLAPFEVAYPPVLSGGVSLGFFGLGFSIGGACCYYPGGAAFTVPHPWSNAYVNRTLGAFDASRISSVYSEHTHIAGARFVPAYGRSAFAITRTTTGGFLSHGRFQSGTSSDPAIFTHGHSMTIASGHTPVFGPDNVRPNAASITPSRSFGASRPSALPLERPVFRSMVPSHIAKTSPPIRRSFGPSQSGSGYRRPSSAATSKYRRSGGQSQTSSPRFNNPRVQFGGNVGGSLPSGSRYRRTNPPGRVGGNPTRPIGGRPVGGSQNHPPPQNGHHGGHG